MEPTDKNTNSNLTETYEVIADYPSSPFEIGDKIEVNSSGRAYISVLNEASEKGDVRDYPHLFKRLNYDPIF